jgi:hypothetical protein
MEYDPNKVDDAVLALLYLNIFDDGDGNIRAWKSFNWDAMDRLFEKGYIEDPKSKAKSVYMSEEGLRRAEELFRRYFVV